MVIGRVVAPVLGAALFAALAWLTYVTRPASTDEQRRLRAELRRRTGRWVGAAPSAADVVGSSRWLSMLFAVFFAGGAMFCAGLLLWWLLVG